MTEVEARVTWTEGKDAKDSWQPPEAGRGQAGPFLSFQRVCGPADAVLLTPGPRAVSGPAVLFKPASPWFPAGRPQEASRAARSPFFQTVVSSPRHLLSRCSVHSCTLAGAQGRRYSRSRSWEEGRRGT